MHPFNHHFPAFTALPSGVGLVRVIVVVELFVRPHAVVLIIVLCGFGGWGVGGGILWVGFASRCDAN